MRITPNWKKIIERFYSRYNNDKHRNDIEIDFLLSNESMINYKMFPIEVKSSKNYSTLSLDEFRKIYKNRINESIVIHPKNLVFEDGLTKIPPYMFFAAFWWYLYRLKNICCILLFFFFYLYFSSVITILDMEEI